MTNQKLTNLADLLAGFVSAKIPQDIHISHLSDDSRKVGPKGLFFALNGETEDGRQYIEHAINAGATVILAESGGELSSHPDCLILTTDDLKAKMGAIVARFYQYDPGSIDLIGVTGTNGKTSIAYLLANLLEGGYIGTLGLGVPYDLSASLNTTPSPLIIQEVLKSLHNEGIKTCAMEVSSHAMTQHRVEGLTFKTAVFTNLSHEHLDYHGTMESYARAKFNLFTKGQIGNAVVNIDCEWGEKLVGELTDVPTMTYALNNRKADIFVKKYEQSLTGIKAEIVTPFGDGLLESSLFCEFNLYNLLAVLAVLLIQSRSLSDALTLIKTQSHITGRMEVVHHHPTFVIDYAHTPDALEKALSNLKTLCKGKLWCVFGCGGNRDKEKRALMGEIAERVADKIVITNDNPRFEKGEAIVTDIIKGLKDKKAPIVELDRAKAIRYAYSKAGQKDVVLIAGKGHETYQIVNGETLHFSDHEVVKQLG